MNNRQSERANLNFKSDFNRKSELLNEALSELAFDLFGLTSTESVLPQIHAKMQRDRLFATTARNVGAHCSFDIIKLLALIETRAQLKEWNTPLALIGR